MKSFQLLVFTFFLGMCFAPSATAQVDDTLPPWFRRPGSILSLKTLDWNGSYILASPRTALVKSSAVQISGKRVSLTGKTKLVKSPLILKRGQACYQIYCQRSRECSDCKMLWHDINGDRRVQPRKELRCVCGSGGTICGLKAQPIECR